MRYNPFNPQQPARPDFFVGREPELTEFEKFLIQTMHDSCMNMSITGNRGMGKTSLLVKMESIAKENKCLVLRMSNYEGNISNIMDLADYISSNLKGEILAKKPIEKMKEWVTSIKPVISWKYLTLTIERKHLIEELFRQRLKQLWEEIKNDFGAIVILIDEAESLEKIEGGLTFIREVFQRVCEDCKYMIVLAGKLNFPERMSESFSPLNRFFPVHKLSPFNNSEINSYLNKKLTPLNIETDKEATGYLIKKSEGHPYVLVAMCYYIFDSLNDDECAININVIKRAQDKIISKLEQDFFSPMYHPLTPKAKEVIGKICISIKGLNFSFREACKWTKLERNYVSPYIQELLKKGIINKPERGNYSIFHPLFIEYVKKVYITYPKDDY